MSETFKAAAQALADNPELRAKVMSATSAQERAQIMRDAGIEVPTHEDVNSGINALAGVAGGAGSSATPATEVIPPQAAAAA